MSLHLLHNTNTYYYLFFTENCLIEQDDHVEVNGIVFNKPFVEKPVSAEDHNIYVYYPSSAGGGSQRLFRKIGSRSSFYSSESTIRKTGSYIYEDFMPTDGTDVKGLYFPNCYNTTNFVLRSNEFTHIFHRGRHFKMLLL